MCLYVKQKFLKLHPILCKAQHGRISPFLLQSVICLSINHNRHALETCHPEEDWHSLVILSGLEHWSQEIGLQPSNSIAILLFNFFNPRPIQISYNPVYTHRCSASSNIQHHYYSTEPDQLWDSPAPYISRKHGSSSFEFRSMDSISCTETISLSG